MQRFILPTASRSVLRCVSRTDTLLVAVRFGASQQQVPSVTPFGCTQVQDMSSSGRGGGFHKAYDLSEPLVDLLGVTQLSRPQVVKKLWDYIKAHELQDSSDKRYIVCDEKMQEVFKTDRVHMFTMNRILSNHLLAKE